MYVTVLHTTYNYVKTCTCIYMYMCVHKIMNMYIHGMYMVQTCMYRFAHSCGGGRIPDVHSRLEIEPDSDTFNHLELRTVVRTRYVPVCTKYIPCYGTVPPCTALYWYVLFTPSTYQVRTIYPLYVPSTYLSKTVCTEYALSTESMIKVRT